MSVDTQRQILLLQQQLERLRKADVGVPSGTSFPSGAPTGMQFYRTDLDLLCVFDGTRWLTRQLFEAKFPNLTYSATADDFTTLQALGQLAAPYLVRWDVFVAVGATNTGAAFWTIRLRDSGGGTIGTITTAAQTISTELLYVLTDASFTQPTTRHYLNVRTEKTGAPTNVSMYSNVQYRLIVV